ncbi:uncharacterized protein BJ212DRAFT_1297420 [Suillus subaureus]|uniref:Uncharacterized protein n=1 Tax=Suillus subaureus TaxID=48587 RepID=A0A9P7JG11_9AGAM|nr:uncharacterized protein BJ212DRAFT_1297420 [Suillus subaureus]KAG1820944.1 hypothetical protein BJ212DRAFT_1297420 [Suillus subaureus]
MFNECSTHYSESILVADVSSQSEDLTTTIKLRVLSKKPLVAPHEFANQSNSSAPQNPPTFLTNQNAIWLQGSARSTAFSTTDVSSGQQFGHGGRSFNWSQLGTNDSKSEQLQDSLSDWLNLNEISQPTNPSLQSMLPNSAAPQELNLSVGESGLSSMQAQTFQNSEFNENSHFKSNSHSFQWQAYGGGDQHFNFDPPFCLGLTLPPSFPTSASQELQHGFEQAGPATFKMLHAQASSSSQAIESSLQEQPSLLNAHDIHLKRISNSMWQEAPMNNDYLNLHTPASLPPLSFPTSQDVNMHPVPSQPPIIVDTQSLNQMIGRSQVLMLKLIFNMGFFPPEVLLTKMANDTLDTAISQFPEEGTAQVVKLKGIIKTTFSNFQKFTNIFLLPVYQLSVSPWKSKEAMDAWCMAKIESLLLDFKFLNAWVQLLVANNLQQIHIPFGHILISSLIEHMLRNKNYSQYISLGTASWEMCLKHTITAISAAYHTALLKFKASPSWVKASLSNEQEKYYYIFIQHFSLLPNLERFILNQMLASMCHALA